MKTTNKITSTDYYTQLAQWLKSLGQEFGFSQVGISDLELNEHSDYLSAWIEKQFHGSMDYMKTRAELRADPTKLLEGTKRIISLRMDYLPEGEPPQTVLQDKRKAYISRYALGRDYHKLIRNRLKHMAKAIEDKLQKDGLSHQYRVFTDSAPVFEKAIAEKSGLGWIGKHTLVIHRQAGSWFFLGEIFTDLPLPTDAPTSQHCGSCSACMDICPTDAIIAPYQLDARKCISYLTIENKDSIPVEYREAIGNRVFGCDDCQLVCPWNKYAKLTQEDDFQPRQELDNQNLIELFQWTEEEFLKKTEGSPIRRTGYAGWMRNLAVALGNAPTDIPTINALENALDVINNQMVREHVIWALKKHQKSLI